MNSKKELKKAINSVCENLFLECVAYTVYSKAPAKENIDAIMTSILVMQMDYLCRISHPEPGMKAKEYYKKLKADFSKQASEIIDQINNLE